MRQDVKASSRIITERATAKQRLVRNLCKYDLKSASSSSSSINPRRNTAGRDPEQDSNRVDSTKHAQNKQLSGKDTVKLSSTETSVALKREECEQYTSHVTFSPSQRARLMLCDTTLAQVFVRVISSMCHAPEWLCVPSSILTLLSSASLSFSSSSSSWTLTSTFSSSMWMSSEQDPLCTSANEESGSLDNNTSLTGYEPNLFDDFHYSETTEIFLQEQSSDTIPSYLHDAELDDETIGRAPSSPLFIQERGRTSEPKTSLSLFWRKFVVKSVVVCLSLRTARPVHELSSLGSSSREKPSLDSENEQIRIFLERQKEQNFADCRRENHKHEFQADYDGRSIQKLNGIIESQRSEIKHTLAEDAQPRRDQQLHHDQLLEQYRDLREAHMKSLNEM